jgi:aspartyl protease family protein
MVIKKFDPNAFGIVIFGTFTGKEGIRRRIKMVLDTGATYTMIPWYIIEELGYNPATSKEFVSMTTASGTIEAPLITIKGVSIFGMLVKNQKVIVHNLPESSRVDGLLGLSYLKHFKLTIDFKKGIMILE